MKSYIELAIVATVCLMLGGLISHVAVPRTVEVETDGPNFLVVGDERIPLVPGMEVELDIYDYASSDGGSRNYESSAIAASPALSSSNADSWMSKFTFSPPALSLDGSTAAGVGIAYKAKITMNSGHVVIIATGALLFVGGVVSFMWWSKKNGVVLMLGGIVLASVGYMFNTYPLLSFIVPALGIAGLVYYWYQQRKATGAGTALEYIVAGVEKAGEAGDAVKVKIAEILRPKDAQNVKAVVTNIKANNPVV